MDNASDILTRHRAWTGDLQSLVDAATRIQSELGLARDGNRPNIRIFRHYQTIGCLEKPSEREGTKGVYGYRHVLEAVAVRVLLADGWKLTKIGEVLAGMADADAERLIVSRGTNPSATYLAADREIFDTDADAADEEFDFDKPEALICQQHAVAPSDAASDALALIAGFRQAAGDQPSAAPVSEPHSRGLGHKGMRQARASSYESLAAPTPRRVAEFTVAPWLRVTLDEEALARTEPGAVLRALADAASILNTFKR